MHSVGISARTSSRFRILRPHAKGGLGEVFVARDEEVHRDVALKEIQGRYADHAESRARFLLEAEITGGLEHPGIVPVYGLGAYADGRPYYAMRFIRGDSLKEAIDAFHTGDTLGRSESERALGLRKLLGRFVDVCNAIAYAHSRGVLHRDLKPGNVMLGKYGETLVVDWGLAKVTGQTETNATDSLPLSAGDPAMTQAGRAMGTPAFMSPEQAEGHWDLIGPACDVYSLGATLYMLLTGQAPFSGNTHEILQRVKRGELPRPRSIKPWIPKALEAVCLKAMALRPEDRYTGALDLAEEVNRWMADNPVTAYREPLWQRTKRWTRRHKPFVSGMTATLLLTTIGSVAGGLWWQRQREELRRGVEISFERIRELQGQEHWSEAQEVLDQADHRLGSGGPEDLRRRIDQARGDLNLVSQLDAIRLRRATLVGGKFDYRTADQDYAAAFREAGLGGEEDGTESVATRIRDSAVGEQMVAALDDWASATQNVKRQAWLLEVARRADPDPWRDRFRDPQVWRDRAALAALVDELLREESQLGKHKPQLLAALGVALQWTQADSVPLLTAAQARLPGDFWLNLELGNALSSAKQWNEAVGYYRGALAVRPNSTAVHNNLGAGLHHKKQLDEAIREFRIAINLDPTFGAAHTNLGSALCDKKDLDQAIREFRRAIELDPKTTEPHNNLGNALHEMKRLDEAIREYDTAIELDAKAAEPHNGIGNVLRDKKRLDEAIREYRRAIELGPKVAVFHNNLGLTLYDTKQLDEAIREYRTAIELDLKYARAHNNLGLALRDMKQLKEAIREYRTAIELDPEFSLARNNLGNALCDMEQLDEAIREYRTAILVNPKDPMAHYNLGYGLRNKKQLHEAIGEFRTAIELDTNYAYAYLSLGQVFFELGRFAEALYASRAGLAFLSGDDPWYDLAGQQVQQCEHMLALDRKLAAILEGKDNSSENGERLDLACLCQQPYKKLYAASARFCAEAFDLDSKLANDMQQQFRYHAACSAALAGTGQGEDVPKPDEKERARLRQQALDWLRADLAAWTRELDTGSPMIRETILKSVGYWKADADLPIRDKEALAKLPESEQEAFRKLWADVDALLKRASKP